MKDKILKLRKEGKTYDEIVEVLGCSKGNVSYHCGNGQKQKTLERQSKRRQKNKEWVINLKKTLKCINCSESRWWVLDFHHRNPNDKEGSVSRLVRDSSKKKTKKEIDKCDILCSNCHRDFHYKENIGV